MPFRLLTVCRGTSLGVTANDRDCNARAHVPDESHCSEKESYCKDDETYCKDDESHCSEKKSYCKDDETYCKDDESHCSEKESYCKDDESHCSEKESYCEGDESHLKDEKSSFSKRPFRYALVVCVSICSITCPCSMLSWSLKSVLVCGILRLFARRLSISEHGTSIKSYSFDRHVLG